RQGEIRQAEMEISNLHKKIEQYEDNDKKNNAIILEQREQLGELQKKNKEITRKNQQLHDRQSKIDNEILKAESQLSLLKELLFEGGFDVNNLP
ncbi:hypothetical protein, partial [Halomonas sp. ND22Bw]|uniref:hypothetical protein n=1 Tax=Halomonas sp. ND22Bw TaxID=2054178 RepID=UPI0015E6A4A5